MDLGPHLGGERRVDEALARDGAEALEARRDDDHAVVARAAAPPRVARVQSALVDDLDGKGVERAAQRGLDALAPVGRAQERTSMPGSAAGIRGRYRRAGGSRRA